MVALWVYLVIIVFYLLIRYHWLRRHLYILAMKLNGPIGLPLIGSTLPFIFCKTEALLYKIYETVEKYESPFIFWLGPLPIIVFKKTRHVEKILCSSKFAHKHDIYDLFKGFLGEGLITASGPLYKSHKKFIQPLFSLEFSAKCVPVFEKHINKCVENLETFVNGDYFDVGHYLHLCTADIMGEILLGYDFEAQKGKNLDYIDDWTKIYKINFARLMRPWLHPKVIYKFSSLGREEERICNRTRDFLQKVTESSNMRRQTIEDVNSVIDTMLEFLESNPGYFNKDDCWSHLLTLYMASEDTIAIISSAACLCFGMYPEYQKKAVDEIYDALGEDPQNVSPKDLTKLPYLEMCLKDIYRLFPIGPYILRKTLQDEQIDQWVLPKGCGIIIPIYNLHRNPKYWKNPNHFHPDHFLPEAEKNRPSYSYIPFSAGPRSCIGKVFANIGVKIILINLLRRFEIEAEGELPDVRLTMDISVRALDGYKLKIKRRVRP